MRLPHNVARMHVQLALDYIDKNGVPPRRRATKFALRANDRSYPPKYVICIAYRSVEGNVSGAEWPPGNFGGGPEANNFLIARGFEIWNEDTDERVRIEAEDEIEESRFPEGKASYRIHRRLERDTKIAKIVKNKRLRDTGDLICDVCGFSFSRSYGDIGVGFIEAHHTIPVSQLKGRKKTRAEEFALVCSNCHRMLHRTTPLLSIEGLRNRLAKAESK
jgi:hypothetical protein